MFADIPVLFHQTLLIKNSIMRQILLIAAFIMSSILIYAQKKLNGRIVDASTNAPLIGATISSGEIATKTDREGNFEIECNSNNRIIISYVGYETLERVIKSCSEVVVISLIPSSTTLSNVEITATSSQNKSLLYQPVSISKIGITEIKRGTGLFLDDAINGNITGVSMQRRTVSAGQQFNIRGYGNGVRGTNGPQSNFDGQGYKVYLNGIPVTDAEGITMMDDIDFGSIGNVEVVKGPAGTLYGLAIAGVVNLRTIRPIVGKSSIGQETLVGSYGLLRSTTSFQTATDHSSLLLNYGYQESDGYMAHTASNKKFANFSGEFDINARQTINTYAGYSKSYDERGGELTIAQYNAGDYSGNPAYIKNNAHSKVTSFRGGVGHTYRFSNLVSNTTTVFGTGTATDVSSAGGWTDKNPLNFGLRSTFDTKFPVSNGISLSGITGAETQTEYAQVIGYTMGANPNDPNGFNIVTGIRSNQYTRSGTLSYFTEWTLALPKDLSLTAGVGNSNMKISLDDRIYAANKPTHFEKNYSNLVSPHVAINKVFSKELSVYAAYSVGYKAPVSSYFFIPYASGVSNTGIVNTGLKPEKGTQYEVGSKGSLLHDRLNYQLALFQAKFKNKMAAVAVPNATNTATLYSYIVNSGAQNNKGIEASLSYEVYESDRGAFRMIRPFGNITYSDFKYEDYKFQFSGTTAPVNYDGKTVAGVAKIVANLGFDLRMAYGFYANFIYNHKDPVLLTLDGANKANGYDIINSKIGFRKSLSSHFDIDVYAGGNNLTGKQYYYMVFVNQLPDAYLPAPKKALLYSGLNLKYNF
jgi:iron complex outermembrane receptor protein